MEYLAFISAMFGHLAWPIIVIIFIFAFRSEIAERLSMLKTASPKDGFGFDVSPQKKDPQTGKEQIVNYEEIMKVLPKDIYGVLDIYKKAIEDALVEYKIDDNASKIQLLINQLANNQILYKYSQIYEKIFGRQIKVLQDLNAINGLVDKSFFQKYYDEAKVTYPVIYENYPLELYINFMKLNQLLFIKDEKYSISIQGQGFLLYLTDDKKVLAKIG